MKLAVIGAGGVGGYFGAILARSGNDVHFIARGKTLEAVRNQGLRIITKDDDFTIKVPATNNPADIGPVDLILFCVKSYDTASAAESVKPILRADGAVLTLQNGIENYEIIGRILGRQRVLPGSALLVSVVQAPGVINQSTRVRKVIFGEIDGTKSERCIRTYELFKAAGIDVELSTEINKVLWRKMAWICAMAGMTSLTRLPMGEIMSHRETKDMFREIMEEVSRVAKSESFDIGDAYIPNQMDFAMQLEKTSTSSMSRDLLEGRKLELSALNGMVAVTGERNGVPTPMNKAVYAALKPYEDGKP
jgi:2-dehydropantoate 2-reductase